LIDCFEIRVGISVRYVVVVVMLILCCRLKEG